MKTNRTLPPLNTLRVFELAAQTLSFTRTAQTLYLTQSAVSKQVQQLEARLGEALFLRLPRGLRLTPAGQVLQEQVSHALDLLEGAMAQIQTPAPARVIRTSMPPTFAAHIGVGAIADFQHQHAEVEVRLQIDNFGIDWEHSDIDLAIEYRYRQESTAAHRLLYGEYILPVCAPAYWERHAQDSAARALATMSLLHIAQREDSYLDWRNWLHTKGYGQVDYRRGLVFETGDLALEAALSGVGITMIDHRFVISCLQQKRLVSPLPQTMDTGRAYYVRIRSETAAVCGVVQDLLQRFITDADRYALPPMCREARRHGQYQEPRTAEVVRCAPL